MVIQDEQLLRMRALYARAEKDDTLTAEDCDELDRRLPLRLRGKHHGIAGNVLVLK